MHYQYELYKAILDAYHSGTVSVEDFANEIKSVYKPEEVEFLKSIL